MIDKNSKSFKRKFDSAVVHGYSSCEGGYGAVSFPIYQTSTYKNPGLGSDIEFIYSRCSNPTRAEVQNTVALLEQGSAVFAFTSGLSAILACFSLLSAGDHVVISDDIYGGAYRMAEEIFKRFNLSFTRVDESNLSAVENAITEKTKMIYLESPTNPMMKVADIKAIAEISKKHGLLLTVDNTFLSPYFQKPLTLGADIVIHSGTKYLTGHNDTTAGFVIVDDEDLAKRLDLIVRTEGNGLSPFDSWLVLRGIQTLPLRMKKHEENALKVAKFLKTVPLVEEVYYVGLEDHPSFEISKKQSTGFGGMLSFTVKDVSKVPQILKGGDVIIFAEGLGGTATLITYPLTQTHASIPKEVRDEIGITDKLIRLSVGIEDAEDIINDLKNMLK